MISNAMSEFQTRLETFLRSRGQSTDATQLSADASTREYFRINWDGYTAIACVYPDSFDQTGHAFLDASRLFLASGLPVADVMDFDGPLGVIIQEDLGDMTVRDALVLADEPMRASIINEAMSLIVRIQAATERAYELGSVASKLRFDIEKLTWELDYFIEHYFGTYLGRPLTGDEFTSITAEFNELSADLESRASVLCHRDYHTANLMIDLHGRMRIIDHQDARIGSPAYDLVSLLLDRITELPSAEWLSEKRGRFLEMRTNVGLSRLDDTAFAEEFDLQAVQRCLKAAGTFAYQSAVRDKNHFIPFIEPMLRVSLRAAEGLGRFPTLQSIIKRELS